MFIDDDSINLISLVNLKPDELIDWINTRKKKLSLSNAKLSMLTNVPEGTLDRILTGKNPEFRYSTIQPIIRYLLGYNEVTPSNESTDYYTSTIEGYKLAVQNKNNSISVLRSTYKSLTQQVEFLKQLNDEKQRIIDSLTKHIEWLEKNTDVVGSAKSKK